MLTNNRVNSHTVVTGSHKSVDRTTMWHINLVDGPWRQTGMHVVCI